MLFLTEFILLFLVATSVNAVQIKDPCQNDFSVFNLFNVFMRWCRITDQSNNDILSFTLTTAFGGSNSIIANNAWLAIGFNNQNQNPMVSLN